MISEKLISIRPFIGSLNFDLSRDFYREIGFEETRLGPDFSVFEGQGVGFYLQNAHVKEWIDNTMVFLEVADADAFYEEMKSKDLPGRFPGARLLPVSEHHWGKKGFFYDPSGILWHFGTFKFRK
jgi:catechol 2,3-dioxygenase-like lactoylglutathione lyase family enzyme